MQLKIRLYAELVRNLSAEIRQGNSEPIRSGVPFEISAPDDFSIADLIGYLDLPMDSVKVVFVNGRARELDWHLEPRDEVGVFPLIGGG